MMIQTDKAIMWCNGRFYWAIATIGFVAASTAAFGALTQAEVDRIVDNEILMCEHEEDAEANAFATTRNRNYYWLDHLLMQNDTSYRYSKRRLQVLRSADILQCPYPYQVNFVTNAINELVAYPEANLPD